MAENTSMQGDNLFLALGKLEGRFEGLAATVADMKADQVVGKQELERALQKGLADILAAVAADSSKVQADVREDIATFKAAIGEMMQWREAYDRRYSALERVVANQETFRVSWASGEAHRRERLTAAQRAAHTTAALVLGGVAVNDLSQLFSLARPWTYIAAHPTQPLTILILIIGAGWAGYRASRPERPAHPAYPPDPTTKPPYQGENHS